MNARILKSLAVDYKKSFSLIIDNKWLYGTILFFVLCGIITKIPSLISQEMLLSQTLGNTIINTGMNQYAQQSISEKIFYAIHSIHPLSVFGSITFPALFGVLGLVIAFLFFYKRIKPIRSVTFSKKIALYSVFVLLLGIALTLIAFFLLKSEALILLGAIVSLVSLGVLSILLLTIIEAVFISLLAALVSVKPLSIESLSEHSVKFIKALFLFNLVLYFASTNFVNQLILLPNYLHLIMPSSVGTFGTLLSNFSSYLSWFMYYFHPIFVIVFIFAPLTMVISSDTKLLSVLKENLTIIRREFGYYLVLTIWTLLLLFILLALSNFINPTVLFSSRLMIVEILHSGIYALIFTLVLMTFYVTAFRKILGVSEKVNYDKKE